MTDNWSDQKKDCYEDFKAKLIEEGFVYKPPAKIIIPPLVNHEAYQEWMAYRRSKLKPVSLKAAEKQFKLLLKYNQEDQQLIIDSSIQNDYQGLFDQRGNSNDKKNTGHTDNSAVGKVREAINQERRQGKDS